ncbi:hypothetical protein F4678DRAFT_32800 [Xylaria arbuscula]|nr:hypothetical protein F4678DRAFT_32800 [Xylaria arbuscula]
MALVSPRLGKRIGSLRSDVIFSFSLFGIGATLVPGSVSLVSLSSRCDHLSLGRVLAYLGTLGKGFGFSFVSFLCVLTLNAIAVL